jgi:hypothetical protein
VSWVWGGGSAWGLGVRLESPHPTLPSVEWSHHSPYVAGFPCRQCHTHSQRRWGRDCGEQAWASPALGPEPPGSVS